MTHPDEWVGARRWRFLLVGCLERDKDFFPPGVSVSQDSFLKYIVFGFGAAHSQTGIPSWGYYSPQSAWGDQFLPTYSIHKHLP